MNLLAFHALHAPQMGRTYAHKMARTYAHRRKQHSMRTHARSRTRERLSTREGTARDGMRGEVRTVARAAHDAIVRSRRRDREILHTLRTAHLQRASTEWHAHTRLRMHKRLSTREGTAQHGFGMRGEARTSACAACTA